MASALTISELIAKEDKNPSIEIFEGASAAAGDWYDCKKLGQAQAVFFGNKSSDSKEIQGTITTTATGQPRINVTCETVTDTFYAVVFGRK